MIHKSFNEQNGAATAQVTFVLPDGLWADTVHLVGDFNHWNQASHPFHYHRKGEWRLTVELQPGRAYHFRYLLNGRDWTTDRTADAYSRSTEGIDHFVVTLPC
jgi:1,4-alpha-glucan branching enzyme